MTIVVVVLLVAVAGFALWRGVSKTRHRRKIGETPLSEVQSESIQRQVPVVARLPQELRAKLDGKVNLFLDQVTFTGCNELEVSEDMRLSIAAQACLLIVNSDTWYDHLTEILVYPGAFKSRQQRHNGYVVTEAEVVRTGESWARGPVVLSWAHARQGAADATDGHNVVIHEFAHRIDALSGQTDGVPVLERNQSYDGWVKTFRTAFQRHVGQVEAGHRTVLDPYGATGPEEFFAVAVEAFIETPKALKQHEPRIYDQLARLFRLDPVHWPDDQGAA